VSRHGERLQVREETANGCSSAAFSDLSTGAAPALLGAQAANTQIVMAVKPIAKIRFADAHDLDIDWLVAL
jgi:hypothetical protein